MAIQNVQQQVGHLVSFTFSGIKGQYFRLGSNLWYLVTRDQLTLQPMYYDLEKLFQAYEARENYKRLQRQYFQKQDKFYKDAIVGGILMGLFIVVGSWLSMDYQAPGSWAMLLLLLIPVYRYVQAFKALRDLYKSLKKAEHPV
jgi:hypothetical protein